MRDGDRWGLRDRTVVVTGGARGIGAATAALLTRRGARVAVLDLVDPEATALGPGVRAWRCDVTDAAALEETVDSVVAHFGGIDVVFANAGVLAIGGVGEPDPAALERTLEVNLMSVWRTARATLPHLRRSGGYLLPVASLAAAVHFPLMSTYAASKAGVEALADAWRLELAAEGVGVGVAYFGHIDTEMARGAQSDRVVRSLMRLGPGFASGALTADQAAAALVRGMERRARRVCAPGWVLPIVLAPGLLEPLYAPLLRRALASGPVGGASSDQVGPLRPPVGGRS